MTGDQEKGRARTEDTISWILRTGVNLSIGLIAFGTVLCFARGNYSGGSEEVRALCGAGGTFPRTIAWVLGGLIHLEGQAVIVAGLVVLISTPVMRIIVSLAAFARERDYRFVAITATVLTLLLVSLLLGKAG